MEMYSFAKAFGAPEGVEVALEAMSTEGERDLVVAMAEQGEFSQSQVAEAMRLSLTEVEELIRSCYKRGFISLTEEGLYVIGSLYSRLDLFAQFENHRWRELPEDVRKKLDNWYLEEYGKRCLPGIVAKLENRARGNYGLEQDRPCHLGNDRVIPLEEALAFTDTIKEDIYVLPCNCRCIAMNCQFPVDTCLQYYRSDAINTPIHRGWGRKVSLEEAKEIIESASKDGLMQTVGDEALCNCDSCCCYPFRSSKRLGSKGIWPRQNYRVLWDDQRCVRCGLCADKCHFDVFEIKISGKVRTMAFDSSRCWGCGLCVQSCPVGALSLQRIE